MKQSVFEHLATNATNQGAQAEQFKSEVMFTRLGPFILFKYNPYNIYKYTDIYIYTDNVQYNTINTRYYLCFN